MKIKLLLGILLFSVVVKAQDFMSWLQVDNQGALEQTMPWQGDKADDVILAKLRSVPVHLRPYLFPMLYGQPQTMSKKILSCPEVMAYKNQVPQKINAYFKNKIDEKKLVFLPPKYYPFLAPEDIRREIEYFLSDKGHNHGMDTRAH